MTMHRTGSRYAALALLTLACHRRVPSRATPDAGAPPPQPPEQAQSSVRRIRSVADVPLNGLRVDAEPGDWLVEGMGLVAVVSNKKGTVVDFGAVGGEDGINSIEPTVFDGLDAPNTVIESAGPSRDGHSVLIQRQILVDPRLELWTYVCIRDGALRLESVATAPGDAFMAATLGEIVSWGNEPTWVEGHGFVSTDGSMSGDFIARQGLGIAYALAPLDGHVVARFPGPEYGYHKAARTGERVETIARHGHSQRRVITIAYARGSIGDAVRALPRLSHQSFDRVPVPEGLPADAYVDVANCDDLPYERISAARPALELPRGCWHLRIGAPGFAPGAWVPVADLSRPDAGWKPRAGVLQWKLRERDNPNDALPVRILVRGQAPTADPDWGEDPRDGASLNVIYADRDGQRAIPPGRYRVKVTRGYEYTAIDTTIDVADRGTAVVRGELARVVDTRGWISADLHVHSIGSMDAPTPLDDRVRALAGAGVEVAVATDHNALTDYTPAIRERGLGRWLTSIVGDELTTRRVLMGHFNVFPLQAGAEPLPYDRVTPSGLLASARSAPPAGAKIAQINHPRMGDIGYFELLRMDPRDVARWRAGSPLAETGFDAIEVFNGDHYAKIDEVERCLSDWYALLDAGIRMTATGNSDSHKITYHEAGTPRNYVQLADDAPEHLDASAFIEAIRKGHVVVSSGPIVRLSIDGHGPGESVPAGPHEISVTVDAAPWVDVTDVELVRHAKKFRSFTVPQSTRARRFEIHVTDTLAHADWIVAVARGKTPMDFLHDPQAMPFGFTNPVWVE